MKPHFFLLFLFAFFSQAVSALDHVLKVKIENQAYNDETIIRFLPSATEGYDNGSDAQKLLSPNPSVPGIFTKSDSVTKLAINALPMLSKSKRVEVFLKIGVAGTYTIKSLVIGNFETGTTIYLHDKETDSWHEFSNERSYSFVLPQITANSQARFEIYFAPKAEITQVNHATCDNSQDGSISLQKRSEILWSCKFKDPLNNIIFDSDSIRDSITVTHLIPGSYKYEVQSDAFGIDSGAFIISALNTLEVDFLYNINYTPLEAIVSFENKSTSQSTYSWSFGDGATSDIEHPVHNYYVDTTYIVELTVESGSCVKSFSHEIEISNYVLSYIETASNETTMMIRNQNEGIIIEGQIEESEALLSVYSISGKEIFNQKLQSGYYTERVRLNHAGTYVICVRTPSAPYLKKIAHIKQ